MEALHLCDGEGKTQEEAGLSMGVSRGTVQRVLASARCKVARALAGQKALAIAGHHNGEEGPSDGASPAKNGLCAGKESSDE